MQFYNVRPRRILRFVQLTVALGALCAASGTMAAERVDYSRDVRPILSEHCYTCHGPDKGARQAGLRLDRRSGLFSDLGDGRAAPFVPGNLEKSEAIQRITSENIFTRMPPVTSDESLTAEEKRTLIAWVKQGTEWERHWAFVPPKHHVAPPVEKEQWCRNPIDRFILAKLEEKGWAPSEQADRSTLIRRVTLDLTGLSPTPAEVEAFLADDRPGAYARLVDRLLASGHYGELWARRWLDLARYADTNGYEKDRPREIWAYRDWVIDAFNADMPFDRFTIKQLAGDMLPDARLADRIATGFHRNTMLNEEGGIDPLQYRYFAMVDRVGVTGTTWLGLTVRCAQCHDHKFDPISQREFYGMMAFFNNVQRRQLTLPSPKLEAQYAEDLRKAEELLGKLPSHWPEPSSWEPAVPLEYRTATGEDPKQLADGSLLFQAPGPPSDRYTIVIETDASSVEQLRVSALTHKSLPRRGPGRVAHGNFVLSEVSIEAAPRNRPGRLRPVSLARATAKIEQPGYPAGAAIDGKPTTGWAVHQPGKPVNKPRHLTVTFEEPVTNSGGTRFVISLDQAHGRHHTIGRVRIALPRKTEQEITPKARAREAFQSWLARERSRSVDWTTIRPTEMSSNLPYLELQEDGSIFVSGDTSKRDTYHVTLPIDGRTVRSIRLEALPDPRLPENGPGMTYYEGPRGDFFMYAFDVTAHDKPIEIASASESYANNRYSGDSSAALTIDGDLRTGWSIHGGQGERHQAVYILDEPLQAERMEIEMRFGRHFASSLGHFRISVSSRADAVARDLPREVEQLLLRPAESLSDQEKQRLFEAFLLHAGELEKYTKKLHALREPPDYPTTLVFEERPPENPRPTYLHIRGEYLNRGEKVTPMTIQVLHPFPDDLPHNRLGFAKWLVAEENPLTARVLVNRHWAAFFGEGIVRTVANFGFQGDSPSHPKLLDWLALQFQEGWSMKDLHRMIVMSATYRQSSEVSPEEYARDPENIFLSRAPRLRLEAEVIRDSALAASGLLVSKIGGPPVKPPQPEGVTEAAYGSPEWTPSTGAARFRRSIYTFQKRTAPYAMYAVFDAPSGETCLAQRNVSNTPLQALTLLNDPMFMELYRGMGRRLASHTGSDVERARFAFRLILTRPPKAAELARILRFVKAQRQRFTSGGADPTRLAGTDGENAAEIATWTALARALFSLDEAITRP